MTKISKIMALTALIMTAFLLMSATQAVAATMKCRAVIFHTKAEIIKVGDVEGHIMGVGESTGLASFETGEVAVVKLNWFADYIKGAGITQGYFRHTFEDGSTIDYKYVANTRLDPKGGGSLFENVSLVTTQGSGRYAGIQGKGTQTGRRVAPLGAGAQIYVDYIVTYTLP